MKTLSEINKDINEYRQEIIELGLQIHPKLLRDINLEDARTDHTLFDNKIKDQFDDLQRKASRYNSIIFSEAKEYFTDLCRDLKTNGIDIGNDNDGEPLESYFGSLVIDFDNFQPSFQVDAIYDVVKKYRESIILVPFWKKNISMYVTEHNIYVQVRSASTPEQYIRNMLESAKTNQLTPIEMFLECIKVELKSSYNMHSSIKNVGNITDGKFIKSYTESVLMHLALEQLLQLEPNQEYTISDIVRNESGLRIDIKGK